MSKADFFLNVSTILISSDKLSPYVFYPFFLLGYSSFLIDFYKKLALSYMHFRYFSSSCFMMQNF